LGDNNLRALSIQSLARALRSCGALTTLEYVQHLLRLNARSRGYTPLTRLRLLVELIHTQKHCRKPDGRQLRLYYCSGVGVVPYAHNASVPIVLAHRRSRYWC